jgi:hypothetical protein
VGPDWWHMTVKIVRGTIPADTAAKNLTSQGAQVPPAAVKLAAGAQQATVSDAITSAIRPTRVSVGEKVRSPEQATKLASTLAEQILSSGSEDDHRYISQSSARGHFIN